VINDHFPFTRGVTLDLSRGTARAIGMHGTSGCACSEKEFAFAVGATMGHLS
jgi:rare lipoprotein A (peptidoglycan hydrolase)